MIKADFYEEPRRSIDYSELTMQIDGDMVCHAIANAANGWCYKVLDGRARPVFPLASEANEYLSKLGLSKELWRERLSMPESLENTLHSVKIVLETIFEDCKFGPANIYLSGKDNYRYKIASDYKSNRASYQEPFHLQSCKDYLVDRWGAVVVDGMEADDAMGIAATENTNSIICTLDKDLDMIPGWHYKWPFNNQAGYRYYITATEAMRCFYKQLITGDTTDNIEGLSERAPKRRTFPTAPLDSMDNEEDMKSYVLSGYIAKYGEGMASQMMEKMGQLLWIRRKRDEMWTIV